MDAIPAEFGYVVVVMVSSIFVLQWMGFQVVKARKRFEVPYPRMYSEHEDRFNCYQRAHQNTLENYPVFLILLVFGGLYAPKIGAASGIVWIVGRVFYALGYYSGDPEKRLRGSFAYIGLIILLICTIMFALTLLGIF